MEFTNLQNSIYIDPLTGLPNFFKFIESDFENMFGERGTILIFDIAYFIKFNEKYGRSNGDLCLRSLAESIRNILLKNGEAIMFRTHGDEFTIILPNSLYLEIEKICYLIKNEFKRIMDSYGFSDVGVHTLILSYDSKIYSVENYYELLLDNLSKKHPEDSQNKFNGDNLLRHIIGGIINRVRDTLTYYNNAQHFALVDDVSGIQNHRAGMLYLTNLINEFKDKSEISILFIDGDNLKRYNNISYEAGNEMIRNLSKIISDTLRVEDKVYRWLSGDEFLVVVNETNEKKVLKLAERIRQTVESENKNFMYPVTVSIGVSSYPKDGSSIDEIINKAEKANSIAKKSGKNKVVIWNDETIKL